MLSDKSTLLSESKPISSESHLNEIFDYKHVGDRTVLSSSLPAFAGIHSHLQSDTPSPDESRTSSPIGMSAPTGGGLLRVRAKNLLERRGSNQSLTISLCSSTEDTILTSCQSWPKEL